MHTQLRDTTLGTLNAAEEVPFVIKAYENGDEVAQYMAFKALGDFAFGGSQEAIDYINKVRALPKDDKSLAILNYLDNVYTK